MLGQSWLLDARRDRCLCSLWILSSLLRHGCLWIYHDFVSCRNGCTGWYSHCLLAEGLLGLSLDGCLNLRRSGRSFLWRTALSDSLHRVRVNNDISIRIGSHVGRRRDRR